MPVNAVGQSISLAVSSLLDSTILFAIYSAFCCAQLLAYFRIFLLRSSCVTITTNNVLSASTFFLYSLQVLSSNN
jgi:hypothetical protein